MVKFWVYSAASLMACAGLLYYTFLTRQQFYPAVIYLVTSKISVVILGNTGLVLTMLFGRALKTVFLGSLRDAEVEILNENVRYAITETCLALTIFREEISFHVVVLFTALVFFKCFHWLAQSRIEFIEQSEIVPRATHVRLVTLMTLLGVIDNSFVALCIIQVFEIGPSVFILFGFEFLILLITLISIAMRYVLFVIDSRMDGNWANKFTYLFYLELFSEISKLLVYMIFFMLIFTYYGLPLHIVRDLWISIRNLQLRLVSYFRYRQITANLNDRFPTPTEEELEQTDRTCIICREEMTAEACKKLPCSHIFHVDCLKMWVQRQQTCPTCRSAIPTGERPRNETPAAPAPAPAPAQAQPPAAPAPFVFPPPAQPAAQPAAAVPPTAPAQAQIPQQTAGVAPPPAYPMFMPPFMFGMPPFGFPYGQPAPGTGGVPTIDSDTIQRQIDMLQAQLAALQASAQAFGIPAVSTPPSSAPASAPAAAPASSSTQPPPAAAPTSSVEVEDDLTEEKMAVPDALQQPSSMNASAITETEEVSEAKSPAPVELPIPPPAQTEVERRREELRQRYARIYSQEQRAAAGNDDDKGEQVD